jgi:hypothetical protein
MGEHLCLARIDRGLKQRNSLVPLNSKSPARVVAFLGYEPAGGEGAKVLVGFPCATGSFTLKL